MKPRDIVRHILTKRLCIVVTICCEDCSRKQDGSDLRQRAVVLPLEGDDRRFAGPLGSFEPVKGRLLFVPGGF